MYKDLENHLQKNFDIQETVLGRAVAGLFHRDQKMIDALFTEQD